MKKGWICGRDLREWRFVGRLCFFTGCPVCSHSTVGCMSSILKFSCCCLVVILCMSRALSSLLRCLTFALRSIVCCKTSDLIIIIIIICVYVACVMRVSFTPVVVAVCWLLVRAVTVLDKWPYCVCCWCAAAAGACHQRYVMPAPVDLFLCLCVSAGWKRVVDCCWSVNRRCDVWVRCVHVLRCLCMCVMRLCVWLL